MDHSSWLRAKQIFQEAIDRDDRERMSFVVEACGDDAALRTEVERLLDAHDGAGGFLDAPTLSPAGASQPLESPGTRVGPYKLLQLLGEGGFGVVYMAEQETPIRRRVALKIIKPGMDTKQVIARFESERQALALMDHPNIAKVLDAGSTASGRPYFVMELVKGVSLTEYCDANTLSTRERLELFVQVCQAVHHAHEKGIVHRDLKPSNVMVTLHDGRPVPKVIDFGIAKATNQRLTERTLFTAYGASIGTPTYMSPEQAEMSGLEIDRRSDVYSLGVLLYELLTGTTPLDAEAVRTAAHAELLRIIREDEPPTPSARLSTLGGQLTEVARNRHAEPQALTKLVRGDLDWVAMKALEKDRQRRYATATDLVSDISRYFANEPVTARQSSAAYRLGKFVRRRRRPLAASVGIAAALLLGGGLAQFGGPALMGVSAPGAVPATEPVRRLLIDRHLDGAPWHDWRPWSASAYMPDGRHVLGYANDTGAFEIVDMESDEVRVLARQAADARLWAYDVRLSPDQQRIAGVFAILGEDSAGRMPRPDQVERWELRVQDVGAESPRPVVAWPGSDIERVLIVDWAPAQDRVWLSITRPGFVTEVAAVDLGSGAARVLKTGVSQRLSLSPDGSLVAYDSDGHVVLLATDGSREIRLDRPDVAAGPGAQSVADSRPVFAPDGSGIVFSSNRRGVRDLWFQPLSGGQPSGDPRVVLADHGPFGIALRFTEKGSLFYFFATTLWDVFTADLTLDQGPVGTPVQVARRDGETNTGAAYSPDGRFFAHLRGGGRRLVTVELETGVERELPVSSFITVGSIDWCPDSSSVIVSGAGAIRVDLERGRAEPQAVPASVLRALCVDGGDMVYLRGAWGPDGAIVRRSAETGQETVLYEATLGTLTGSLDGTQVAFVAATGSEAQLMVMPSSGGDARVVASSPARHPGIGPPQTEFRGVMWLPDGSGLLVVRAPLADTSRLGREETWTVSRLPIDGGPTVEIGTMQVTVGSIYPPQNFSLSPDGNRFAFERNTGIIEQDWEVANLLQFIRSGATHEAPFARSR